MFRYSYGYLRTLEQSVSFSIVTRIRILFAFIAIQQNVWFVKNKIPFFNVMYHILVDFKTKSAILWTLLGISALVKLLQQLFTVYE